MKLLRSKKFRVFVLTAVMAMMFVTASFALKVTATTTINVRKKATTNSKIVTIMTRGQKRTVLKTKGNWYRIKINGKKGYVRKDLVTTGSLTSNSSSGSSTGFRSSVVNEVKRHLGKPYVWGANGPYSFDCSGLTKYVYKKCGKTIPRVAEDQYYASKKVSFSNLKKGHLVFFSSVPGGSYISHVGIYIGNGYFIHAANPDDGVITSSLYSNYYSAHYYGAGRY